MNRQSLLPTCILYLSHRSDNLILALQKENKSFLNLYVNVTYVQLKHKCSLGNSFSQLFFLYEKYVVLSFRKNKFVFIILEQG